MSKYNNLELPKHDPAKIKAESKQLVKFPNKYYAGVFKRTKARITQAFKGEAPLLLHKIYLHNLLLKKKNFNRKVNNN